MKLSGYCCTADSINEQAEPHNINGLYRFGILSSVSLGKTGARGRLMLRCACNRNDEDRRTNGHCEKGVALIAELNGASCESEWLGSLLEVLVDRLDHAGEHIDPERSVKLAADVGRIAREWSDRLTGKMLGAEELSAQAEIRRAD
jgi:hypothetical protein